MQEKDLYIVAIVAIVGIVLMVLVAGNSQQKVVFVDENSVGEVAYGSQVAIPPSTFKAGVEYGLTLETSPK